MYGIFPVYSIHGAYDKMGYIISSLLLIILFHASPKKMSDKIQPKRSLSLQIHAADVPSTIPTCHVQGRKERYG